MAGILQRFHFLIRFIVIFIRISLKLLLTSPTDNKSASVRVMACRRTGNKSLSEPMLTKISLHDMASLGHNRLKDGMGVTLLIILSDFTLVFVWPPEQKSTREYIRRTCGSFNCIRLTHWARLKNAAMLKTFSNSLSCMKLVFFVFFYSNLTEIWSKVESTIWLWLWNISLIEVIADLSLQT